MFKITDTMVLSLMKKGFVYEAKDVDVNMDMKMPLSALTMDDDHADVFVEMKMTCKVGEYKIKLSSDEI